jgi:hypothetical protein
MVKNFKNVTQPFKLMNGVSVHPHKEITGYESFTLDDVFSKLEDLQAINAKHKKYIPEVISEFGQKRLRDFYNNVTLNKYYNNRGLIHNKNIIEDIPGDFTYLKEGDPRRIENASGHSQFGNAYIYEGSSDYEGTVIHEGIHNKRDNNKEVLVHQIG